MEYALKGKDWLLIGWARSNSRVYVNRFNFELREE
jgi:hypothetical protein